MLDEFIQFMNKRYRIPKRQSRMEHKEKLASLGTLISTKRILLSHLNSLNTIIPYFVGNPGTILGQAYQYDGVKSINGIPSFQKM
jgi:hypothetical protein